MILLCQHIEKKILGQCCSTTRASLNDLAVLELHAVAGAENRGDELYFHILAPVGHKYQSEPLPIEEQDFLNSLPVISNIKSTICHPSGCTVVSGVVVVVVVVVGVCKCTCLIFGVSIGLDPG